MLQRLAKPGLELSIRWENKRLICADKSPLQAAKHHSNVIKQGKILTKLFGGRTTGSKKRWIPSNNMTISEAKGALSATTDIGKSVRRNSKDASRRMKVLNKLFMSHITDLLATGEVSEQILGKGLQIFRTKVSQDFAYISVYWMGTGDTKTDIELEAELKRCSGVLRHQLSQLDLMGRVPRIQFVKDNSQASMQQVETVLKKLAVDSDKEGEQSLEDYSNQIEKAHFFGSDISVIQSYEDDNMELPKMRHDVFGLDHSAIMNRILAKMHKSQDAWQAYEQRTEDDVKHLEEPKKSSNKYSFKFDEDNDAKLRAFIAENSRNTNGMSERKNKQREEFTSHFDSEDYYDEPDTVISPEQKKLYDAEDYLDEDAFNIDHRYEEKQFK